ncbi:MAG: hypothetical protein ABIB43_05780 [archaeon]
MDYQISVYLAGSFTDFRDKIINALPGIKFIDPRLNRQSHMAKTNIDDIYGATDEADAFVVCFPEGKTPGIMTLAEVGAAHSVGISIITANENHAGNNGSKTTQLEEKLLKDVSDYYFTSIDDQLIPFLKEKSIDIATKRIFKENLGTIKNVYFAGTVNYGLDRVAEFASKIRPDKNFILRSEDIYEDYKRIDDFDLMMVHFPKNLYWDRPTCFMLGAAFVRNIPTVIYDENVFPYPPLTGGLQRRLTNDLIGMLDYAVSVDEGNISKEAVNMYEFFKRYGAK